jgi:serine-type D-Ala-D-Ala carboxypeptidase/endopeptidase (penicillin-binding protein 4)
MAAMVGRLRSLLFAMLVGGAALAPLPTAAGAPLPPGTEVVRACVSHPDVEAPSRPVPADLAAALDTHLADERLRGVGLGLSLWIEGYGEVRAVNPEFRLRPASNQKLLTAIAALEVLGPATTLPTRVAASGTISGGVLDGDLYLIGGGDPTLAASGPHSLEALAAAVRAAGITRVDGAVVADESRYDDLRKVEHWGEGLIPRWVGSLSALMVDGNRYRGDPAFIADPAGANGALFAGALATAGVTVVRWGDTGSVPRDAREIAGVASPPLRDLVRIMLEESDNTIAEMLVKEVGKVGRGVGSTASGMKVLATTALHFCLPQTVLQYDGSGLSDGNARSARQWRELLQAVQSAPWWEDLLAALPVAAETGTLRARFRGTAAAGNLRAKTGTIHGLRALSGMLSTAGSRRVFFSAIVDDDDAPRAAMAVIDELLVTVAADDS